MVAMLARREHKLYSGSACERYEKRGQWLITVKLAAPTHGADDSRRFFTKHGLG
jgi:hypothetical protein